MGKSLSDSGVQGAVHQAVDVAFSLADLLGGLFSEEKYSRTLASVDGASALQLVLDSTDNSPTFVNTHATAIGVIHATQSRAASADPDGGVPLSSQVTYVQPGTSVPFANFQNFTKGLLTACVVDPAATANVPIAALTGRGMTASTGVTLGSTALFDVDGTGITYQNNDQKGNYHIPVFTVVTGPPNRTFTVGQEDIAPNTVSRIPFPEDVSGQVFDQLNAVLAAPVAALNPEGPQSGAGGQPRRRSSSENFSPSKRRRPNS